MTYATFSFAVYTIFPFAWLVNLASVLIDPEIPRLIVDLGLVPRPHKPRLLFSLDFRRGCL